jgi:hypothetical protein
MMRLRRGTGFSLGSADESEIEGTPSKERECSLPDLLGLGPDVVESGEELLGKARRKSG